MPIDPGPKRKVRVRVQCSWCKKYFGTTEIEVTGPKDPKVTHIICDECKRKQDEEADNSPPLPPERDW